MHSAQPDVLLNYYTRYINYKSNLFWKKDWLILNCAMWCWAIKSEVQQIGDSCQFKEGFEEKAVVNCSKCDFSLILILLSNNWFYHSKLANEPTGTIVSLWVLWFLDNVANSVIKRPISQELPSSYFFKMLNNCITLIFKQRVVK